MINTTKKTGLLIKVAAAALIVLFAAAAVCPPNVHAASGFVVYHNEEMGFELTFPESWDSICSYDDRPWQGILNVSFYHEELFKNEEGGYVFSIFKASHDEYKELTSYLPGIMGVLHKDDKFVYFADGPTDWQGGEPGNIYFNEYMMMYEDVEGILKTFKIYRHIKVLLNGKEISFDQPPVLKDGRTLVPVRAIFEAMGAVVNWDDKTQTVTAVRGNTTVVMQIGNTVMKVNDEKIILDVPPQILNSRTLVPARAVAESFGADVKWDDKTSTVTITAK